MTQHRQLPTTKQGLYVISKAADVDHTARRCCGALHLLAEFIPAKALVVPVHSTTVRQRTARYMVIIRHHFADVILPCAGGAENDVALINPLTQGMQHAASQPGSDPALVRVGGQINRDKSLVEVTPVIRQLAGEVFFQPPKADVTLLVAFGSVNTFAARHHAVVATIRRHPPAP